MDTPPTLIAPGILNPKDFFSPGLKIPGGEGIDPVFEWIRRQP
jgi:hypothetical protein